MDDGSLRETDVWISQGGLTFRGLCRMTLPPIKKASCGIPQEAF